MLLQFYSQVSVSISICASHAVAPVLSGSCGHQNFDIMVKYGTPDFHFQIVLGKQWLTPTLAQHYGMNDHGTHIAFSVPFTDHSSVFEVWAKCFPALWLHILMLLLMATNANLLNPPPPILGD